MLKVGNIDTALMDVQSKPILRPKSDLNKKIEIDGVCCSYLTHIDKICNLSIDKDLDIDVAFTHYFVELEQIQSYLTFLYSHHFDVFGLIEKGLAIDCNSINN